MIAINARHAEAMAFCHRMHAAEAFHAAWVLWQRPARSSEQQRDMLIAAHACAEHWAMAGDHEDRARAELLLAQVHLAVGQISVACIHARRVIRLVSTKRLDPAIAIEAYRALADAAEESDRDDDHQHLLHILALIVGSMRTDSAVAIPATDVAKS